MGKTRELFKKIRDTKRIFYAKMGTIKDRNSRDLTETEETKKRWHPFVESSLGLLEEGVCLYSPLFLTALLCCVLRCRVWTVPLSSSGKKHLELKFQNSLITKHGRCCHRGGRRVKNTLKDLPCLDLKSQVSQRRLFLNLYGKIEVY